MASSEIWRDAGRILNAGQTRSLLITGNIHDLFEVEHHDETSYQPLVDLLTTKWDLPNAIVVVYELTGIIRFVGKEDKTKMKDAWVQWRTGMDDDDRAIKRMLASQKVRAELDLVGDAFDTNLKRSVGNPTLALTLLKQMCMCSRAESGLDEHLIVILENAEMIIRQTEISRMTDADRNRVSLCQDWFSDPHFQEGKDSVIMIAESRSLVNTRIAQLPQVLSLEVNAPDKDERLAFINWFDAKHDGKLKVWSDKEELAQLTAGLSTHALQQMLKGAIYRDEELQQNAILKKVESYIQSQLGEDVVEFKKPSHYLEHVVGFSNLKEFLNDELIPRFRSSGRDALPGAAVCGPIGSGKTFIFEAVASELDMVVIELKSIRSQWYGQTDVVFERLRRVLMALSKVMIFVDEADTQFGSVGKQAHATERRLTGKIQAMMSDPRLRGRVLWLLMTARIHLLSPDIRRPGRVGDLIIPILDPRGEDRDDFLRWMAGSVLETEIDEPTLKTLRKATKGYFAASYAALRSELKAKASYADDKKLSVEEVIAIVENQIPPNIGPTRKYQTLQALMNCTRRNLLPDPDVTDEDRLAWAQEIKRLEAMGVE